MKPGRFFSIFSTQCMRDPCTQPGDTFGYCKPHFAEEIQARHERLSAQGKTRPKPHCFHSEAQWREYEVFALDAPDSRLPKADPCSDCTPDYRARMAAAGLCDRPETVFIKRRGALEGITAQRYSLWLKACRGEAGVVVGMPAIDDRMAVEVRITGHQPSPCRKATD